MDGISEARLLAVHPQLAGRIRQLDLNYQKSYPGDFLKVQQGLRSWQEQQALWLKGRDGAGNIVNKALVVTHAPPGHSWHQFGLAVDLCPAALLPVTGWAPNDQRWIVLGALGEAAGLIWGGRWSVDKIDRPHFQLTGSLPVSPTDYVRDAYIQGGVDAVWTAAGLYSPPSPDQPA